MDTIFLVFGCVAFGSGCLLAILANCIPSKLIDEINEKSPPDQQVGTFRITETILRRHQQLYPHSSNRRLMNAAMISAVLMWGAGVCLLLDYSSLHDLNRDEVVAPRQLSTIGTLTGGPAGRNSYGYTFSLGEASYNGWGSVYGPDPKIGQQFRVYYDPSDPSVNALAPFEYSSRQRAWDIAIGLLTTFVVAAVSAVSIRICWRLWDRSDGTSPGAQ
jgi:hypothetical protein